MKFITIYTIYQWIMTNSFSKAVRIPESKNSWSSIKDASEYIKKCWEKVANGGTLTQEEINHLWLIDANLMNRRHENLALHVREVYNDLDSGTCLDVKGRLKTLLKVLQAANVRRKQKLALKKAGISKDQ